MNGQQTNGRSSWERRAEHAEAALRVIASYHSLSYLRRKSTGQYGLEYTEALEMAYENIIGGAKSALRGLRNKPRRVEKCGNCGGTLK